jgi:hypothetical protein
MGIFSRKSARVAGPPPNPAPAIPNTTDLPVQPSDEVVRRISELMEQFNTACGTDSGLVRQIAKSLAAAAGATTLDEIWEDANRPGIPETVQAMIVNRRLQRPWDMLESVTVKAAEGHDVVLAGRIFAFTYYWHKFCDPQLGPADHLELMLDEVFPIALANIAAAALDPLLSLPTDYVVFGNATGAFLAGDLAQVAAGTIIQGHEDNLLVPDRALATARQILT